MGVGGGRVMYRGGRTSLRFCGPKLSVACAVISAWGVVQLTIMAVLLKNNSVAFVEDLAINSTLEAEYWKSEDKENLQKVFESGFSASGMNCWVAAALYLATLLVSLWQYRLNSAAPQANRYQTFDR